MPIYFNAEDINSLLKDFYAICRIRVTVFDDLGNEVTSYPNHRCRFCAHMREISADFDASCDSCDQEHMELAAKQKEPLIYKCHAGLTEIIAPLRGREGKLVGFLFFSHILNYPSHDKAWNAIQEAVRRYNADEQETQSYLDEMRLFDSDYLRSAATVLLSASNYLCESKIIGLRHEEAGEKLDKYINDHLSENLSTIALCEAFSFSRSALYQLAGDLYEESLANHIKKLRIEKAKTLLQEDPTLPISEVAERTGYPDYCYFIVAFKKEVGLTPKKYAQQAAKKATSKKL